MARIIESQNSIRRTIRLSSNDIISIVQEYQQLVKNFRHIEDIRDILENQVLYLPED